MAGMPVAWAYLPVMTDARNGQHSGNDVYACSNRMPSTASRLEVQTILCNNITIKDVEKFGRNEMGGDLSEEVLVNGWAERTFIGCRWIITIKQQLVPNNTFWHFTEPKYLGKHFLLEDTTMWIKKEAFLLEFFAYQTAGLSIGNTNGITKCVISRTDPA